MYRLQYFILSSMFFLSCSDTNKKKAKKPESVNHKTNSYSFTIDLLSLKSKNLLINSQKVNVEMDPVYHKSKTYNGLVLKNIIENYSGLNPEKYEETKIIFECEDGYKPEMPLNKLLSADSYLAISDVDAPKGSDWERIYKDGHEMKAAPFYIVYKGVSVKDGSYKWPYNVVKLHFVPANNDIELIFPKEKNAESGYKLFQRHCKTCHSINGIGGTMGPELNVPKNVTEYWKENDLEAFIKNPASYRKNVKMPTLTISKKEISEIVYYLNVMVHQKIQ